jgi:23S rRNA (guanine1835-N2)-methyltransferase
MVVADLPIKLDLHTQGMEINNTLKFSRFDLSEDRSLRAWSAADEYLLSVFKEEVEPSSVAIYNDRFGFLSGHIHSISPVVVTTNKSQEQAISANLNQNGLSELTFLSPFEDIKTPVNRVLMKMPKSLGMFQLYLDHLVRNSTDEVTVTFAFMTRHFSASLLKMAGEYFEVVEQSKAIKKARLIHLSQKRPRVKRDLTTSISYADRIYKQYLGVFSSDHIDYATQYFLENIATDESQETVLDLGSGNGVIGIEIGSKLPGAEIHLLDDSIFAIESAKLNSTGEEFHHHYANDLEIFKDETFDLIASNPPFHFEYDINIQIPIALFKSCYRCLKTEGELQLVANKHLNYLTHLKPIFNSVEVLAENQKFVVYKCVK